MKVITLLLFSFLACSNIAICQKAFGNSWIIGSGISYKVYFSNNQIYINYFDTNYNYRFIHGSSCISDSNGKLKIISNGYQVFDSSGIHLENGDSLVPNLLYDKYDGFSYLSQSSIILPVGASTYYLITPTASDAQTNNWNNNISYHFDLLLSHKIDMSIGPHGKVLKKAVPLLQNTKLSKTQMMAVRHGSGIGWWLFKKATDTNMYYRFMVTKDSIVNMGTQGFAQPHFGDYDLAGQSMFNQSGTQFANTCSSLGTDYIFLADFDRCEGNLSNPKVFGVPDLPTSSTDTTLDIAPSGLCFSPNGRFIYLSKYNHIFQLDLTDPDSTTAWYHVAARDTTNMAFQGYGNLYIGPDNKVYVSNWGGLSKQMSVIDSPDIKGSACNFCPRCLRFPKWGPEGPPCMPNYALGKDSSITCWPLSLVSNQKEQANFKCYPNPSSTSLTIELTTNNKRLVPIEIYNMVGELVLKTELQSKTKVQINISSLPKGLYVIRCEGVSQKVVVE